MGSLPGGYSPVDFVRDNGTWRPNGHAIDEFNAWAAVRRARAMRAAITQPIWNVYSDHLPVSNFNEQQRAWPGVDLNNWTIQPEPISGNWSSPSTYLGTEGQRYKESLAFLTLQARRAVAWLDRRNDVRSAMATGANVAPWYSNPDFGREPDEDRNAHRLQWAAGLLHDRTLGVHVMLFWSNGPWSADEIAFAQPLIAYLQAMDVSQVHAIQKIDEGSAESTLSHWTAIAAKIALK